MRTNLQFYDLFGNLFDATDLAHCYIRFWICLVPLDFKIGNIFLTFSLFGRLQVQTLKLMFIFKDGSISSLNCLAFCTIVHLDLTFSRSSFI